jgi:RNA polymerase sigma-70 factor (ECF subfamily)
MLKKMNREIENLPEKIKEIFVLSKTNGYTNLEISKNLNISIKTVESNITKAYKILRKKLEN